MSYNGYTVNQIKKWRKNPLGKTKERITIRKDGQIYKQLQKAYEEYIMETIPITDDHCIEWRKNPIRDPRTDDIIYGTNDNRVYDQFLQRCGKPDFPGAREKGEQRFGEGKKPTLNFSSLPTAVTQNSLGDFLDSKSLLTFSRVNKDTYKTIDGKFWETRYRKEEGEPLPDYKNSLSRKESYFQNKLVKYLKKNSLDFKGFKTLAIYGSKETLLSALEDLRFKQSLLIQIAQYSPLEIARSISLPYKNIVIPNLSKDPRNFQRIRDLYQDLIKEEVQEILSKADDFYKENIESYLNFIEKNPL